MELSEYQALSRRTAEYPRDAWLAYPALGLAGEAGEVAEHAKKAIRDHGGEVSEERRAAMAKELGDVLWYVAQLASELGLELEDVAQANLDKLLAPAARGALRQRRRSLSQRAPHPHRRPSEPRFRRRQFPRYLDIAGIRFAKYASVLYSCNTFQSTGPDCRPSSLLTSRRGSQVRSKSVFSSALLAFSVGAFIAATTASASRSPPT